MSVARWVLAAIAFAGIGYSWVLFPTENRYSIMTHTISFLGSPDADRNPPGWRYYIVGMTAALALLILLTESRRRTLRPVLGKAANWTATVSALSLFMMILSVWMPDARETEWFGVRIGVFHNAIVIPAIFMLMIAIVAEGIFVGRSKLPPSVKWPYRGFGILFATGLTALIGWEIYCANNPSVKSWPGEGICSTPLWEWALFVYLLGFSFVLGHRKTVAHFSDAA